MSTRPLDPRLRVLLITPAIDEKPGWLATVEAALSGGIRAVQLRDKHAPAARLLAHAQALRRLTDQYQALFFMNGRVDVAAASRADGVHVGRFEMPPAEARKLLGPTAWVGYSAHLGDTSSSWAGADFVTLSPVFESPGKGAPLGPDVLATFVRAAGLPVLALGGMGIGTAKLALRAGADGVAVIREIFAAPNPAQMAQRLCALVQEGFDGATSGS